MLYVLDVENTTTTRNDKLHLDPFEEGNSLTMIGMRSVLDDTSHYAVFDHAEVEQKAEPSSARMVIQEALNETTLLIMHNAQHDLMWLWECGFIYDGDIYDTMLGEYILNRGITQPLSLDACAERRRLPIQKQDTLKEYFKKGYTTREIPLDELTDYLRHDLEVTRLLYLRQQEDYAKPDSHSLHQVVKVTMEVCKTLTRMYCAGVKIDTDALAAVKKEYEKELADIEERLYRHIRLLMGDTQINLNSPEQMSTVVFSRSPNNKKEWVNIFDHTNSDKEFKNAVYNNTRIAYKTQAYLCPECKGERYISKIRKDGKPFAKPSRCKECDAEGFKLRETKEVAGLKFFPPDKRWVTANGFGTSKDNLTVLINVAKSLKMEQAEAFLNDLQRMSAISNYLSTFVGGIEAYMKPNTKMLHVGLTQHITATGRFSGRNPNMQNMPRGGTFPIKKAFISRWEGGQIMEADFAQLEFRVAAFLAQDPVAMKEVATGFDVHSYTAKIITNAGQVTTRQGAKAHCVTMDAEALTQKGWKHYNDLRVGDMILTYNQDKDQNEWKPILELAHFTDEEVWTYGNSFWKVTTTPNHRWYGKRRTGKGKNRYFVNSIFTAEEMTTEHSITSAAFCVEGGSLTLTAKEAAILGWVLSDGTHRWSAFSGKTAQGKDGRRQGCVAYVIQKKQPYVDELNALLEGYTSSVVEQEGGCFKWSIKAEAFRDIWRKAELDTENPDYVTMVINMSVEAREAFLDAFIKAEGHRRKHGQWRVSQNQGPEAEALRVAATLCGYDTRVTTVLSRTGKLHDVYTLRTRKHNGCIRFTKEAAGKADVWCPRTENGTWVMRQGKVVTISGNTFAPLYGATGFGRTAAEAAYYHHFIEKYEGIAHWHKQLGDEAIRFQKITTPSGRQYAFPDVYRRKNGSVSDFTRIKNYPVQGFATADVVPVILMEIERRLYDYRSCIVNTVHDSIVIDVHPDEADDVIGIIKLVDAQLVKLVEEAYGVTINVPMKLEAKIGANWLQTKDVA